MSDLGYLILKPSLARASQEMPTWVLQDLEQRLGSYQDLLVATERALQEAKMQEVPARHPTALESDPQHVGGT
jgi:hypothetical protein